MTHSMKKMKYVLTVLLTGALPSLAAAQALPATSNQVTVHTVLGVIVTYINDLLALLMGIAVALFVWYVIKYLMRPSTDRSEGGQYIMWSLIGFFVILSMWGIVNILMQTFNLGQQNSPGTWASFTNVLPQSSPSTVTH